MSALFNEFFPEQQPTTTANGKKSKFGILQAKEVTK